MRITKDSTQPIYSERVKVKQVEPHAIMLLKQTFGGSQRIDKPSKPNGKPLYSWQVTDLKAALALQKLIPYLRIKRQQAENCMRLRELKELSRRIRVRRGRGHVGGALRPERISTQMESAFLNAKLLNRVGV